MLYAKRLMSLLLSVSMIMSLLPTAAFASGDVISIGEDDVVVTDESEEMGPSKDFAFSDVSENIAAEPRPETEDIVFEPEEEGRAIVLDEPAAVQNGESVTIHQDESTPDLMMVSEDPLTVEDAVDPAEEVTLAAEAASAAGLTPQDGTRYTVLLVDSSGSMSGTPLNEARKAAEKFCDALLSTDPKSYVAIVRYGSQAEVLCPYSNDLSVIKNQIDRLNANAGGTNTYAALTTAEALMEGVPDGTIRNVVLLSDGLPESGQTVGNGPYTYNDGSVYAYANAVYAKASDLKKSVNLYSLGLFHSLRGSDLSFGKKLMKDVAGGEDMYYEVSDVRDLEFVFGEIVDSISQSALRRIYVEQHLDNIKNGDYESDIVPRFGESLMQVFEEVSEDSSVRNYNLAADIRDAMNFDVDLTGEYELLIAQLMLNDQTYQGIKDDFVSSFQSNLNSVLESTIEVLKASNKVSKVSNEAKIIEVAMQMLEEAYLSDRYFELYEEYKGLVNKSFDSYKIKKVLNGASLAFSLADIPVSSMAETIEYCCIGQAYYDVSDDFTQVLILLLYQAKSNAWSSDVEGLKSLQQLLEMTELQAAIITYITTMEDYKEDSAKATANYFVDKIKDKAGSAIAGFTADKLYELGIHAAGVLSGGTVTAVLKSIKLAKEGFELGLSLTEIFTDIDERAASGDMVVKLFVITALLDKVAEQTSGKLQSSISQDLSIDQQFRWASQFDETINMYRTSTLLASDYGVRYEKTRLEDESARLFPSAIKVSWHSTAISLAATEKLKANDIHCHRVGLKYDHKTNITFDNKALKIFTVACPVEVTVKDASGKQLAWLGDDESTVQPGYEPYFYTVKNENDDVVKVAVVPDDPNYTITLSGVGSGSMDAYAARYNGKKVEGSNAYLDIPVHSGDAGFFVDDDGAGDVDQILFDGNRYSPTDVASTQYRLIDTHGTGRATVVIDQPKYSSAKNSSFTITATLQMPEDYVSGSKRYTGYIAFLANREWIQLGAWYMHGGKVTREIPVSVGDAAPGDLLFVIAIFPSDNFATGGSICDQMFTVSILPETVNVNFDPVGGACATKSKTVTCGKPYGTLPTPTRDGYAFCGWYTNRDCTEGKTDAYTNVSTGRQHTLYAKWKKRQVLVELDSNGGSCAKRAMVVGDGSKYGTLPEPLRKDYKFLGWYTAATGGAAVSSDAIAVQTTLYAHWEHLRPMADCSVELSASSFSYSGKQIRPTVSVRYRGQPLKEGTDYSRSYFNNQNVGTATVIVTGEGDYCESVAKSFSIVKAAQSLTLSSGTSLVVGKQLSVAVTGNKGDISFTSENTKVATVSKSGVVKGIAPGAATITVTSTGNKYYKKAIKSIRVEVKCAAPKLAKVENATNGVKVSWIKTAGAAKYRVYYKTGSNSWSKAGDATGTSLVWKKAKSGVRYAFTVRCLDASGKLVSGYDKTGKSITFVTSPTISKLVNAKSGILSVTWKKVSGVSGFEIQHSLNKGFKSGVKKTTAKASATTAQLKSLSKGKTWYVRVRSYKTISGKKVYAAWSAKKGAKVTK